MSGHMIPQFNPRQICFILNLQTKIKQKKNKIDFFSNAKISP